MTGVVERTAEVVSPASDGESFPMIVSVDDHVVEPPHVWQTWLPEKFKADGPRIERRGISDIKFITGSNYKLDFDDNAPKADCWVFGDRIIANRRNSVVVEFEDGHLMTNDERTMDPVTFDEMRPGCYEPQARIADMQMNHIEASLCFPSFPRFCGQTFLEATPDRDLGFACVRAYNDWMVEEWCGDSGGRLIPLCLVPLWDADLAAAEVRYNAARGVRAVTFSEIPSHLGLPSIHSGYWDPFFEACDETGTVVCMHIGSSSKMPATSADAPPSVAVTLTFNNAMGSLADFLFSGLLHKFPNLKLAYSEGQIGWLPYVLERVDDVWKTDRAWLNARNAVPEPPSTYFRRQVYGCFFRDYFGLASLDYIGVDNVTFETDYPHGDSTWPHTLEVAKEMFVNLSEEATYKIARGNAIRLFGLDLDKSRRG